MCRITYPNFSSFGLRIGEIKSVTEKKRKKNKKKAPNGPVSDYSLRARRDAGQKVVHSMPSLLSVQVNA